MLPHTRTHAKPPQQNPASNIAAPGGGRDAWPCCDLHNPHAQPKQDKDAEYCPGCDNGAICGNVGCKPQRPKEADHA